MWPTILLASLSTLSLKLMGYFLPNSLLGNTTAKRIIALLPIGLLSGLIAIQMVTSTSGYVLDGRIVGAVVALALLMIRSPFIVVISAAALVTAMGRAMGYWA